MVNYRRNKLESPDAIYFLTIATNHRWKWFESPENATFCIYAMNNITGKYKTFFTAWVILPDHIHWLIKPGESDYSKIVFAFKRRVTARVRNNINPGENIDIWQDRFWEHTVKDEKEYAFYVDYIHYNPVKHGYVRSPKDWEFSSFRDYAKRGYYDEDWSLREEITIDGDVFEQGESRHA